MKGHLFREIIFSICFIMNKFVFVKYISEFVETLTCTIVVFLFLGQK